MFECPACIMKDVDRLVTNQYQTERFDRLHEIFGLGDWFDLNDNDCSENDLSLSQLLIRLAFPQQVGKLLHDASFENYITNQSTTHFDNIQNSCGCCIGNLYIWRLHILHQWLDRVILRQRKDMVALAASYICQATNRIFLNLCVVEVKQLHQTRYQVNHLADV